MVPDEVVHYTTKEVALEHILFEKKIRFGLLGLTNDPRESKIWSIPLIHSWPGSLPPDRAIKDPIIEIQLVNKFLNKVITEEWKVFCVSKNSSNNTSDFKKHPLLEEFTKGYNHPRLWSNYSGLHTGVCLIFDGNKLDNIIHKTLSKTHRIFQGSVTYDNLHSIASELIDTTGIDKNNYKSLVREFLYKNYEWLFLTKSQDWESESEYRWLIHNHTKKQVYVPIDGVITSVLLGADFPPAYENIIRYFCKELNISAAKIDWINGLPRIHQGNIYKP